VNLEIKARQVRLINTDGTQLGIVPVEEALTKAKAAGLDLVEVSGDAEPPVCKILDYGKFKYGSQRKKEHIPTRKQHFGQIKEIRIRPKIDKHDLARKLTHGRELLEDGYRLLLTCVFRGREMTHLELGRKLLADSTEALGEVAKLERTLPQEGRRMAIMLMPKVEVVRAKTQERDKIARVRAAEIEATRKKSKRKREPDRKPPGPGPAGEPASAPPAGGAVPTDGGAALASKIEGLDVTAAPEPEPEEKKNAQAENAQGNP
jgi:translation initiation factor IF-3